MLCINDQCHCCLKKSKFISADIQKKQNVLIMANLVLDLVILILGPVFHSAVSLMKSLVEDSLSLRVLTKPNAVIFFCWKIVRSFCSVWGCIRTCENNFIILDKQNMYTSWSGHEHFSYASRFFLWKCLCGLPIETSSFLKCYFHVP